MTAEKNGSRQRNVVYISTHFSAFSKSQLQKPIGGQREKKGE